MADDPFAKVLDLARQVIGGTDQVFTEEGQINEEDERLWQETLAKARDYNGEFRYVNKSPTELKRLLETETRPEELEAIELALRYWRSQDPLPGTTAGEPYRGEPKVAITADSISALARDRNPVEFVPESIGQMGQGLPEKFKSGEGLGMVQGPGGIWEET